MAGHLKTVCLRLCVCEVFFVGVFFVCFCFVLFFWCSMATNVGMFGFFFCFFFGGGGGIFRRGPYTALFPELFNVKQYLKESGPLPLRDYYTII